MLYEVISRYIFKSPTIWSYELTGMLMGPYWILCSVHTMVEKQHIRLELLYRHLSPRTQAITDAITWGFFWFYIGVVLYYGWGEFVHAFTEGTRSRSFWGPPMWPWRLLVPVGCGLLLLQGIVRYGGIIYKAVTGRELEV